MGCEYIKDFYANEHDFVDIYMAHEKSTFGKFYRHKVFFLLLKKKKIMPT